MSRTGREAPAQSATGSGVPAQSATGPGAQGQSASGPGAPAESATADREIVMSQVIRAPREVVFEAFTEVRHLSRWWGPDGFTTTTRAFDFRVGGVWDFVMHGPDGTDYQEFITWTEIATPVRIALVHGEFRGDPNAFEVRFQNAVDELGHRAGPRPRSCLRQPLLWNGADQRLAHQPPVHAELAATPAMLPT